MNETERYVLQYGGMCRDCADENGVCPNSRMPCGTDQRLAVVRHTLAALEYGVRNGFIENLIAPKQGETIKITDEMIEAFGNVFWPVNAASKIDGSRDDLRLALEAAVSAGQESMAVKVKPLEWGRSVMPPFIASARTPVGTYHVESRGANGWWWMFSGMLGDEGHASEDDAKAAAQADYENRILSAIEGTEE